MTEAVSTKTTFEQDFGKGYKMFRPTHNASRSREVRLDIPQDWLPFIHEEAELLSPTLHLDRDLTYLYTEELIKRFPRVKQEAKVSKELLAVLETLLHAMDYLTHERFLNAPFAETDKQDIDEIIGDVFDEKKKRQFSTDANRPLLNKSPLFSDEKGVFVKDIRDDRTRIYVVVLYKKTDSLTEHFNHVGHWIGETNMKPNVARVSFAEMLEGKTDVELHERTLFYLNTIKRTLSWFFNSTSWRSGELYGFDRMDIISKLGIHR